MYKISFNLCLRGRCIVYVTKYIISISKMLELRDSNITFWTLELQNEVFFIQWALIIVIKGLVNHYINSFPMNLTLDPRVTASNDVWLVVFSWSRLSSQLIGCSLWMLFSDWLMHFNSVSWGIWKKVFDFLISSAFSFLFSLTFCAMVLNTLWLIWKMFFFLNNTSMYL